MYKVGWWVVWCILIVHTLVCSLVHKVVPGLVHNLVCSLVHNAHCGVWCWCTTASCSSVTWGVTSTGDGRPLTNIVLAKIIITVDWVKYVLHMLKS